MPDVTCPRCGNVQTFDVFDQMADEFCKGLNGRDCEYPLFWAPSDVPVTESTVNSDGTLRRLPGAGGRFLVDMKVCPRKECGEHNPLAAKVCIRCSYDFDEKAPAPEPTPEPVLMHIPPPPPEPRKRRRWWPWALLAVAIIAIIVVLLLA